MAFSNIDDDLSGLFLCELFMWNELIEYRFRMLLLIQFFIIFFPCGVKTDSGWY